MQAIVGRQCLLVLGMHRSGTSVVAGLLAHLGATAPRSLMAGDANNPAGYWESQAIHDFHERLLCRAGTRWDSWTRIPSDWMTGSAQLREEAAGLLRTEFCDDIRFVLKDPRICRLVPFWLGTLTGAGITPAAVLVVRNPHDVARSLERRNGLPRTTSLLMWLRHVLEAEYNSRDIARSVVRSEEVFDDWKPVADRIGRELGVPWPTRSGEKEIEISRFVRSGARQIEDEPAEDGTSEPLLTVVNRTWTAMAALQGPTPSGITEALRSLDDIRAEFDEMTRIVDVVAGGLESRHQVEIGELADRVAAVTMELQTARADLQATQSELHAAQAALRESRSQMTVLQKDLMASSTRADGLEHRLADLEAERTRLSQLVTDLYESKSWRITAPLRAVWSIVISRNRS